MLATSRSVLAMPGSEADRKVAFPDFQQSNPKLFAILCSGRCELSYLETMLDRIDDIEAGNSTVEKASKEISDRLNKDYIESVVPQPTAEQAALPGVGPSIKYNTPVVEASLGQTKKGTKRPHDHAQ